MQSRKRTQNQRNYAQKNERFFSFFFFFLTTLVLTAHARLVFCFTVKRLQFGLQFNHESSYKRSTLANH